MNIMIVDCHRKFFYDIAESLIEKGHHVNYIATSYDYEDFSDRNCFNNTKFLDRKNFTHAELINKLNLTNDDCLSKQILENFMECESIVLSISDRLSFFPLSVRERKNLYHQLLLYWHSFFRKESIDLLLFCYGLPHMPWTVVVNYVAQRQNIPTKYIEGTLMKNRVLLSTPFSNLQEPPSDYLKNYQKDEIINIIGTSLIDDVFSVSEESALSNRVIQDALSDKERLEITKPRVKKTFHEKGFMSFASFLYKRIKHIVANIKYFAISAPDLFKEAAVHHAFYFNPHFKNVTLDLISFLFKRKVFSLYRFYQRHVTEVNYNSKFVFFALHYQPEATTFPLGGVFENQLLAIKILSASIPKDWTIYVKEHPRQFETKIVSRKDIRKGISLERRHYRNKEDYRNMLRIGNVKLVDVRENTLELIRKSVFTATITGSVGWESLLERKACVNFANSWYSSCNSCYVISSVDECKRAIRDLLKKLSTEVETDVLKFLAYYKDRFIVSTPTLYHATKSDVKYDVLVDNLANRLIAGSAKSPVESERDANAEQTLGHSA